MPIITSRNRDTLVRALREITDLPPDRAERPPLVVGARVLPPVAEPGAVRALAARVRDGRPLHAGIGAPSPLQELREELEDVVVGAFAPVEIRTDLRVRLAATGPCTEAGDPWPCRAVGAGEAGWWTSVRWAMAVDAPAGASYTLHAADGDLTLAAPGALAVLGPRVASTLRGGPGASGAWVTARIGVRFRHRWLDLRRPLSRSA